MNLGSAQTPSVPPLRFSLTIVDGRARLAGSPGPVPGLGRVDRLALEVPGLRFPFDLSQGSRVFQSRRCRLVEFGFSVAPVELELALGRAALGRFGLADPAVALLPVGLRLGLRVKVAGREAELSAKVALDPLAQGLWRITLQDARVHGFVPVPAPLLLAALPAAFGLANAGADVVGPAGVSGAHWTASPPALLRPRGLTEIDVDLAEMVLVSLLPAAGWRLPSREGMGSRPVDRTGGRLGFTLGPQEAAEPLVAADEAPLAAASSGSSDRGLAALAEAALFAGEVRPATEGFRRALAAQPDNDFARERLFQLLGASADGLAELEAIADDALVARPGFLLALVAKAVAAAEDGRAPEAAWLYARVAAEAEAGGEIFDEVAARVAAAEQFARAGDEAAALASLHQALERRPDHAGAKRLMAERTKGAP